jgi:hypothetical protein
MTKRALVIKITISVLSIPIGILFAYLFNYNFLHEIIIGNQEAYDTEGIKTGIIFSLFYIISSNTGYHPEPSTLNFIFTALCGVIISFSISYILIWRKDKSTNAQ